MGGGRAMGGGSGAKMSACDATNWRLPRSFHRGTSGRPQPPHISRALGRASSQSGSRWASHGQCARCRTRPSWRICGSPPDDSGPIGPASDFGVRRDELDTGDQAARGKGVRNGTNCAGESLVRIRLSLQYRCHTRQMLAVAGSRAPLGWSFLSIARNAMRWSEGDWWTIELDLPEGSKLDYKYVILEDQAWSVLADEDSQGLVPLYRHKDGGEGEPDVEQIVRKMAIVAWKPGSNIVFHLPMAEDVREREPLGPGSPESIPVVKKQDLWL